uniref:Bardet-Biedl syndrome 1 N-terminal domain-containing protein n=1 Tax=Eutreptiella gymnastica TaxID=73025 RepID=A0A7S1IQI7_9EUGL|mmetsp:Transcript_35731/g.63845  ORF Transcript_35731/g.63845 Transcript_35731/m.63845 type:complete len:611 (+) Transcript_35731:97-1929(+)
MMKEEEGLAQEGEETNPTTTNQTEGDEKENKDKKEEEKGSGLWLDAWKDPLAGVRAFSNCLELADIAGDGSHKLLVADASRTLKVFSGTELVAENPLLDVPSAICCFYMSYNDAVHRPAVAISSGPYIYIYMNLRPYYKFTLPPVEVNQVEADIWANLRNQKITIAQAVEDLENAKENGVSLTSRSLDLLALEDDGDKQMSYVAEHKNSPLVQQTVIVTMAVLKKDKEEHGAIGCLVIGTENCRILILDPTGSSIMKKVSLPSIPAFIVATGLYDVDYRIVVACRNGNIYTVRDGELTGVVIELESQPCGLCRVDKSIMVGTMANVMHSYHVKGKKQYSVYMPCGITNMTALSMETMRTTKATIVALANGEIRVYNAKSLIHTLQTNDIITGLKFGKYAREDNTLVIAYRSGTIHIKMLPRLASLEATKGQNAGPPPEQNIPIRVPKKTRLYIEQTQREKEFGTEMHRVFQRDLCKLRLATARAYVKVLTDGQGPLSYTSGSSLRLTAHVQGLGPLFKIKLNIQNTGTKSLTAIPIVFTFNQSIYRMPNPTLLLPLLVPSLVYNYEVDVECIDEAAGADVIRVYVCNPNSAIPIITALVNMPLADFLLSQ